MSGHGLRALAEEAGLAVEWRDNAGRINTVAPDTLRAVLAAMGFPADREAAIAASRAALAARAAALPPVLTMTVGADGVAVPAATVGERWRLVLENGTTREGTLVAGWNGEPRLPALDVPGWHVLELGGRRATVAAAPPRCVSLDGNERIWGLAAQVYALRRAGDRGVGDHGALALLGEAAAREGAACLAMSPQHALFAADPHRYGPYAPSSRLFLNPLHADPALVFPGAASAPAVDDGDLVDWPAVSSRTLAAFRALFARHTDDPRFAAFRAREGRPLEDHARFEVLHAHHVARGGAYDWRRWPPPFRDPRSAEVASFARAHEGEAAFHAFLQFLADASLAETQRRLGDAGMAIGLITDLAVGADPAGSQAWSAPEQILTGVSVGAPPDAFSPLGQDWGLTAFSPTALADTGYAGFLGVLRAALRHAGGVRIDHVMGLARLWLIPPGATAREGVYVRYPLDDLLRLIALESWEHRAIVIGEDLGTLPEGFRDRLEAAEVLGMRVLWFERDGAGVFTDPARWSRRAVAMTTTHDLPTVVGWWQGRDIDWRRRLDRFPDAASADAEEAARDRDRAALWQAMCRSGAASGAPPGEADAASVADAAIRHVGSAASVLTLLPLEDACALAEQPNLPGTVDGHPNWRRRLPADGGACLGQPDTRRRIAMLSASRHAAEKL
ncbi:4-alpha-glucanotransferase [Elioraea sp.]|uniref:4-alpha-glucanotransferase n=1 Tax=Elioraea sp. TaxID=2185103 RepID=UPI003F71EECE